MENQNKKGKAANIEGRINEALQRLEDYVLSEDPQMMDLNMNIVNDYTNPQKEEICRELNKLPSLMAYFNQIKVYTHLLLENAERSLFLAEITQRDKYKKMYDDRVEKYTIDIQRMFKEAIDSKNDKAMNIVNTMVKTLKPERPTDKEIEAFIKKNTIKEYNNVLDCQYKYDKLRDLCKALDNKFLSVRALRYTLEDNQDKN